MAGALTRMLGRAASGGGGGSSDPYFSSVVLLMGMEGTNNSTSFVDESSYARAMTANGDAKISTTSPLVGTSSAVMTAAGGGYISTPDAAAFTLGTSPFTLECKVRLNNTTTRHGYLGQKNNSDDADAAFQFYTNINDLRLNLIYNTSSSALTAVAWSPVAGTDYWLCAERDASNNIRLYVDGVMKTKQNVGSINVNNSGNPLYIGRSFNNSFHQLDGRIDEVRFTVGVARYASDAGYTVPTGAFPRS